MELKLTWDLFIIVFFAVIVAYSFIIGRSNTLKIVLVTYVAALAADGAGNLFERYFGSSPVFQKLLNFFTLTSNAEVTVILKLLFFVTLLILLASRGGFLVEAPQENSSLVKIVMTGFFGFLSAGLMVSIVLIYVSGVSFITGSVQPSSPSLIEIYDNSLLAKNMIDYYNVWFFLPAAAFIVSGFLNHMSSEQ